MKQGIPIHSASGLNLDGEDLRPLSLGERKEEGFAQKLGLSNPQAPAGTEYWLVSRVMRNWLEATLVEVCARS